MKQILLLIVVSLCSLASCTRNFPYTPEVNSSLNKAGRNRKELIKVLEHYKQNPTDSLKYKAACFLITNMPYHGHYKKNKEFEEVFDSINHYPFEDKRSAHLLELLMSVQRTKKSFNRSFVPDIEAFDVNSLIEYIDTVFEAWNRIPIQKKASFEEFSEHILPYSVANEPIRYKTRRRLNEQHAWVLQLLKEGNSLKFVVDSLTPTFNFKLLGDIYKYYPVPLSLDQVEKSRRGTCDDVAMYFVNVLRSLGIVASKDYIPHWGNHYSSGHSWLYAKYGNEEYSCNIGVKVNLKNKFEYNSIIPKIYRTAFKYKGANLFDSTGKDVSNEYFTTNNFIIKNEFKSTLKKPVLCVFDSKRDWVSVDNGVVEDNNVKYKNVGIEGEILFIALSESVYGKTPINYPFYFNKNKDIIYLRPDKSSLETIKLTRKYGLTSPRERFKLDRIKSLNNGIFEASNDSTFSNSTELFRISNLNSTHSIRIPLTNNQKFKYVRFNSNGKKHT